MSTAAVLEAFRHVQDHDHPDTTQETHFLGVALEAMGLIPMVVK